MLRSKNKIIKVQTQIPTPTMEKTSAQTRLASTYTVSVVNCDTKALVMAE
jgi:hypothetical protein